MLGVDYIYTNLVRKDLNENRKIYEAKCLHCGKGFKNHRSLRKHLKSCLVIENQQTITDFLKSYYAPPVEKMTLTSFQENLIEFFVSTNISIQSVESPVTKKFLKVSVSSKMIFLQQKCSGECYNVMQIKLKNKI